MQIEEIIQGKKGKLIIRAEGGLSFPLYEKEAAKYRLTEGGTLTEQEWNEICSEILENGQNDGLCTFCSAWSARSVSSAGNCRRTVIRKKSWSVHGLCEVFSLCG